MKAAPERRRRVLEWGKTALILLLTASAAALIARSPLIRGSGLQPGQSTAQNAPATQSTLPEAAIPVRMAAGSGKGIYGVQYDQDAVDALFAQAGPLLGEVLSAADEPEEIPETRWMELFDGEFLYFDYVGAMPLEVLGHWLKGGGTGPAASVRHIVLSPGGGDALCLFFQDEADGTFYQSRTALSAQLHLSAVLSGITPNGAFFAFQDDGLRGILTMCTLLTDGGDQPEIYNCASPVPLTGSAQIEWLLSALNFSDQNQANVSGSLLYVEGENTLRLLSTGEVRYHGSAAGKYPAGEGLSGAVDAAWTLVKATAGTLCGQGRLFLISAVQEPEGVYTVTFGYTLNGCEVYLYDEGWAAQVRIESGAVSDFTLRLRAYAGSGARALLLPAEKAAVGLSALSDSPRELMVQYRDGGGTELVPNWVGR